MIDFLDGASCLACAAVAMVFLRFWRLGGDRLLLLFGLAFLVLAVNRIGLAVLDASARFFDGLACPVPALVRVVYLHAGVLPARA